MTAFDWTVFFANWEMTATVLIFGIGAIVYVLKLVRNIVAGTWAILRSVLIGR